MTTEMAIRKKFIAVIILNLFLFLLNSGCSTFQSTKTIDMAPFSETMTSLVGDIQFGIQGKSWIYLKPYLKRPSVLKVREGLLDIGKLLRGIVFYSLQVVSLNSAQISETKKCELLGQYLDDALRPSLTHQNEGRQYEISISPDTLSRIIKEIKSQKNFIDGLNKAQPLIDAVIGYSDGTFNELKEDVTIAANEIFASIDTNFAAIRTGKLDIEKLQTRSVRSYWLLYCYRFGEKAALDSLLKVDPAFYSFISPNHEISPENFTALEKQIMQRMHNIDIIKRQLDPEFELYKAHLKELDEISIFVNEIMRKARIAMIVFARSHRNLAEGVTVPPAIDIMRQANKVVEKIVP